MLIEFASPMTTHDRTNALDFHHDDSQISEKWDSKMKQAIMHLEHDSFQTGF